MLTRSPLLQLAALTLCLFIAGCSGEGAKNKPDATPAEVSPPTSPTAPQTTTKRKPNAKWAQQLFDQKEYDKALEEASQVLLSDPDNAQALYVMALVLHSKGELNPAIETLKSIPESDLLYGAASRASLVDWLTLEGRWDESEKEIKKLISQPRVLNESKKRYFILMNLCGRRYEANSAIEELLAEGFVGRDEVLFLLDPAEPMDTRTRAQEILKKYPNDSLAHLAIANYNMFLQDYEAAILGFQKVLSLRNDIPSAKANLALVYARLERWAACGQVLSQVQDDALLFPNTWIAAGLLFESMGRNDQAIVAYTKALERFSAETEALRGLSRCLLIEKEEAASQDTGERLAKATLIRERLKLLSRNLDDFKTMGLISDDLTFFGRNHEAFVWYTFANHSRMSESSVNQQMDAFRKIINSEPVNLGVLWPSIAKWSKVPLNLAELDLKSLGEPPQGDGNSSVAIASSIKFTEIGAEIGTTFDYDKGPTYNGGFNLYQTNGGGVGVLDYDRDGWPDMYLPQASGKPLQPSPTRINALYRNMDGQAAIESHRQAQILNKSWGQGVAVGDFDSDGFADVLVACIGSSELWHNCGDGTFEQWPLPLTDFDQESMTISAALADINGDGLPDIVEANYADSKTVIAKLCSSDDGHVRTCSPTEFASAPDRIHINQGDGSFALVNESWTLPIDGGRGLGVLVGNFDREFGNDVYIANDMNANHYLVSVEDKSSAAGRLRLREEGSIRGLSVDGQGRAQASMGMASGDLNRDGILDIFITNFYDEFNVVYLGKRGGMFVDATAKMGLANANKQTLGFGTQAVDFDRDGYLDLAIVNGHVDDFQSEGKPFAMKPEVYQGTSGGFKLVPNSSLGAYFDSATVARVLSTIDWNRDLKIDLIATHLDRNMAMLRNDTETSGHAIQFELIGTASDRDATGAYLQVKAGGESWTASVVRGGGFECSNEAIIDLGIGSHTMVDEVEITWPSGTTQVIKSLPADQRYQVIEGIGEAAL